MGWMNCCHPHNPPSYHSTAIPVKFGSKVDGFLHLLVIIVFQGNPDTDPLENNDGKETKNSSDIMRHTRVTLCETARGNHC
jgi:hypothetical protein